MTIKKKNVVCLCTEEKKQKKIMKLDFISTLNKRNKKTKKKHEYIYLCTLSCD